MTSTRRLTHPTPLGPLTLVAEGEALAGVFWPDHPVDAARAEAGSVVAQDSFLATVSAQLDEYLAGERSVFELPLALHPRSGLEGAVWREIAAVGHAETTSYGEIAARLGDPHLAQAVGGATGHNPASIVVPCHRVVGSGGKCTGFAGGTDRKAYLLALEAHVAGRTLFAPALPAADRFPR